MGDGISTRVQKELTQLHQQHEKMRSDLDAMASQLRSEFRNDLQSGLDSGLAKLSMELKQTMEQLFQRQESLTHSFQGSPANGSKSPFVEMPSSSNVTTGDTPQSFTKHSKLECPRFTGDDFLGWHSRIEQFFAADNTPENEKIRLVRMHLEGRALQWHLHFMRTKGTNPASWMEYILAMRVRFGSSQYFDGLAELASFKQSEKQSIDEYYDLFEPLLNLSQLTDRQGLSIFVINIKPDLSRAVRLSTPLTYMRR
ncbi:Retrotransposon gag protein [Corchorus olitorius]|uniref:Retrotransposon gag protein n=1 Tax=Corchorus olitorius TaxID=93759 RepID=A0A1R3JTN6_9ROSI|nr:Retrotransposon gag protein [Corchorus olitorius]